MTLLHTHDKCDTPRSGTPSLQMVFPTGQFWIGHQNGVIRKHDNCKDGHHICNIWMRRVAQEWVMSHICMRHVTQMNESRHTYEWVTSHIWMSHVTHMNESCHSHEWVMSHIWTSHVTHMNVQQVIRGVNNCWTWRRNGFFAADRWVLVFSNYGVATTSRMLKNIGLFCKRALQKRPVFCKETCIFKHPTHRSHPIPKH